MRASTSQTTRRAIGPGAWRILFYSLGGFGLAAVITAGFATLRPHAESPSAAGAQAQTPHTGLAPQDATYGSLPSWLPHSITPVGRVVQASAAHPWIGIGGDTIVVHIAGQSVDASMVGPQVPRQGVFPMPKTSPCTFIVSLTHASGSIPLNPSDFLIVDQRGRLHRTVVHAADGRAPMRSVSRGHTTTIRLDTVLPTGPGEVVWTTNGRTPIVSFEFVTEID
jgi:hypothetical protein